MLFNDEYGPLGRALTKTAVVLIRQSTLKQRLHHTGSGDMQRAQGAHLMQLGWPADRIVEIDARGESGRDGAHRPQFARLLDMMNSGTVGLVAVARSDRLGRNDVDSAVFLQGAAKHRVLILVGGRIYNPASDADQMMLGIMTKFAEYENNARIRYMLQARFTKARQMQYPIFLPTGLVWASPEDQGYVRRLKDAGLSHWLDNLDAHRASPRRGGKPYYALPYPDAALERSVRLRLEWMLETGDPSKVLERIESAPEWPRPGLIPVMRAATYDPSLKLEWLPGTREQQWARLKQWILSPALYGAYQYSSKRLEETAETEGTRFKVSIAEAFPSFADPEDEEHVRAIYTTQVRTWMRGSYQGPRRHALSSLTCAAPTEEGPCGRKMTAMYQESGKCGYYSVSCGSRGHSVPHVRSSVDDEVLAAALSRFDPALVKAAVRSLQVDSEASLLRRKELDAEIAALERRIRTVQEMEVEAKLNGDLEDRIRWREMRKDLQTDRDHRRTLLSATRAEEEELRALEGSDLERILTLGEDLGRLLQCARERDPAVYRRIVKELVSRVDFERISGFAYRVELVFPTGEKLNRLVFTRNFVATQPALVWAHGRVADGADHEEVVAELNRAEPRNHRVAWDTERVTTAWYVNEHAGPAALREGEYRPARTLARAMGVDRWGVLVAAFQDRLGPAIYDAGDLLLCPTEEEIHAAIPEAARREVARAQGWPLKDTARVSDLVAESGHSKQVTKTLAKRGSGLARDAAGRLYARRSEIPMDLAEAIRHALERDAPEHLALDPAGWTPCSEVVRRFPEVTSITVMRRHPRVRPGMGYTGINSVYLWVDPEVDQGTRA